MGEGWTWVNEDPARWTISGDGWPEIVAANPSVLGSSPQIEQVNLLTRPIPEGNFVVTAHVQAAPDQNFQQAAISLIQDGDNYVAVLIGRCQPCLPASHGGCRVLHGGF